MNICESLGLKPNQEFKVKDKEFKYRFNENDELEYYSRIIRDWNLYSNAMVLIAILHDSNLIEVVKEKIEIGMSYHDTIILNGLVKMNKSKIVIIFRSSDCEDGRISFMFENGKILTLLYYDVKLNFWVDFDYEKFEVKYEDDGGVKVWGIRE